MLLPVILMVIVFAYRYRESNTKATYRPNWAHSNKIELVIVDRADYHYRDIGNHHMEKQPMNLIPINH